MQQHPIMIPAYSDEAATLLSKHVLPISLKYASQDDPWNGSNRASLTLLKLGERNVFVTCCHVLEKLHTIQRHNSSAEMVAYLVSDPSFPIAPGPCFAVLNSFTLIDHERSSLDVAIFRGMEDEVYLPGKIFIDYASSYLSDPQPGETVCIVGYPGANVSVTRENATFGFIHIGYRASSVSERQIILANEHGDRIFTDYNVPVRDGIFLGGLSGSPAFVIRENRHRFVGIVTDCSGGDQSTDETIIISRLGCIKPDGTIDHVAVAW